ncbi:hypothetical protein Q9966_012151 [Columba livia]|nr:hypothetical protein Q9966_012151 [Columba livia]
MAGRLFLQPHLAPTIQKLERYEFAKIWASASSHLSLQLALHQVVRIPGIGTFAVVTKRVALSEQDLVMVERPVFQLEQAVAQDHELRCGCIDIPGRQDVEQLPFAQIASENAVSEGTVQLYMKRTTHLFHACLENRENVAIIWRDVGMLIVQGKDIKMRFYLDFLERLNGSGKMLQALLEMPEMRDSVISRHDTAASQTSSGRVMVLPWYQLETVPKMPVLIDLPGRVPRRGDGSGKKEDVAEKRLLRRARLSPNRLPALPVKPEQGQKAEGSEPRARQLPAVQRSCLKEKEEKGKLPPLVGPGTVDFIARAMERREKREKKKREKKKKKKEEQLPQYIRKFLEEEEKKKKEAAAAEKRKQHSAGAMKAKAEAEKETPSVTGKGEQPKEMQRIQESSSSECSSDSSPSSVESDESSCDQLEIRTIMENWEDAGEEPPTVPEDNSVPPKRSLSPRTDRALREVVTCILGQVARKRRGERDEQLDLQDKLQCELAVLRWERSGKEAGSSQRLREAAPQAAPPARPGERRAGPAQPRECTEEGRRKLWDSLRSKIEQKRSSGTAKGLEKRARATGGPEFAKIWASASSHLSLQLALHQVGLTSSSPSHPDER